MTPIPARPTPRLRVGEHHRQSMNASILLRTSSAPIRTAFDTNRAKKVHQTSPERLPIAYRVDGLSATLHLSSGLLTIVIRGILNLFGLFCLAACVTAPCKDTVNRALSPEALPHRR